MKIRFLLDENLPPRIEGALRDLDAQIDVIRVGDPGTPTLGTLDPDILTYLESSQRVLVTGNHRSIQAPGSAHGSGLASLWDRLGAQGHPLF